MACHLIDVERCAVRHHVQAIIVIHCLSRPINALLDSMTFSVHFLLLTASVLIVVKEEGLGQSRSHSLRSRPVLAVALFWHRFEPGLVRNLTLLLLALELERVISVTGPGGQHLR